LTIGDGLPNQANIWVVDSGATKHMTNHPEQVSDVVYHDGIVTAAGGKQLKSIGSGNVTVTAVSISKVEVRLVIQDVLIVPDLGTNLLSVERIMEKGASVSFTKGGSRFKIKGHEFEVIPGKDGLYMWQHQPVTTLESEEKTFMTTHDKSTLWHRRLGHRHDESIKKLCDRDVGIPKDFQGEESCDVCKTSKHTLTSFPSSCERRADHPFELVHMDLVGPIEVKSLGGATYALEIVDEYSRWLTVYGMNSKSMSLNTFKQYLLDVQAIWEPAIELKV